MCLIVFSYKQHPDYELIFAANRDEFYERPTRPAQFWEDYPRVLAGKDLEAGGTWMGITKSGRFSALTNYRDPNIKKDHPPSRGHLVLGYLIEQADPGNYMERVNKKADRYNGFNLLAGNSQELVYYSNQEQKIKQLNPGVYGLSNHLLDTPWPKVEQAKADLQIVAGQKVVDKESLFGILQNDAYAPDEALPDTGIPLELERAVSSVFIKTAEYGTRASTVLLIDKKGKVTFEERRFKKGTRKVLESSFFEFEIERIIERG